MYNIYFALGIYRQEKPMMYYLRIVTINNSVFYHFKFIYIDQYFK